MPDGRGNARVPWLASLRDGRTVLATGHADGAVHLRDPLSRNSFGELWRSEGQPVADMTFGEDLIVVYGSLDVDVWSPIAVSGERSSMAPKSEYLHANGHRHIVAVCPARGLGYRKPILLADRNGTVSMWETFGVRLRDPLPPDPRHPRSHRHRRVRRFRRNGLPGRRKPPNLAAFVQLFFFGIITLRPAVANLHRPHPHCTGPVSFSVR
jgi:hypothetical protein